MGCFLLSGDQENGPKNAWSEQQKPVWSCRGVEHTKMPSDGDARVESTEGHSGLFLGFCGLGTDSWVLVIHPVALIKNWKHGLKRLRQNVDHADEHFPHTTQPRAHTSQLGRCRQVSKNISAGAGRFQQMFRQVLGSGMLRGFPMDATQKSPTRQTIVRMTIKRIIISFALVPRYLIFQILQYCPVVFVFGTNVCYRKVCHPNRAFVWRA